MQGIFRVPLQIYLQSLFGIYSFTKCFVFHHSPTTNSSNKKRGGKGRKKEIAFQWQCTHHFHANVLSLCIIDELFHSQKIFPLIVVSATHKICLLNYKVSLRCGCTSSLKDLQSNCFICCLLNLLAKLYLSLNLHQDLFRRPLVVTDTQNRLHILDCVMESDRQVDKQWIRQKDCIITSCGILYGKCWFWLNIVLEKCAWCSLRVI